MTQNERYLTLIIKSQMRAFWSSFNSWNFDVLRRASTKIISKLSVSELSHSLILSLLIFFNVRSSKNIKIWKVSKSSHFRLDNQRQISLVLSHSCRDRKRLISSINLRNFYVAILQTHCEYSEHVRTFVSRRILSWSD